MPRPPASLIPEIHLDVPPGWEASVEIELLEPAADALGAPLALQNAAPRPRANILVKRSPSDERDPAEALHSFLIELGRHAQALKRLDEGKLTFADGAVGAFATVSYDAAPGLRVSQRHLYRVDGGTITHLTASVEDRDRRKIEEELTPIMKTFRA